MASSTPHVGFEFSPQQRRVWALSRGLEHSPFVAEGTLLFRGDITAHALENAWRQACRHFEILRSEVVDLPGFEFPFLQVAESDSPTSLPLIHHRIEPHPNQDVALFLSGPSFLLDARSFDVLGLWLARELRGLAQEPAIAYFDLSQWQNHVLTTPENGPQLEYWRHWRWADLTQMDGESFSKESLAHPYRPKSLEYRPAQVPPEELANLAKGYQSEPDAILFAAWAFLLSQWFQTAHLVVGIQMDGRPFEDMANVLGPFEKQLPIPFEITAQTTFPELLRATQERLEDAFDRQEFFSWNPCLLKTLIYQEGLFPFGFETAGPRPIYSDAGLSVQGQKIRVCNERNHLRLCVESGTANGRWVLTFDSNRVSEPIARDLLLRLETLLKALLEDPRRNLHQLSLLTPDEILVLQTWNAQGEDLPFQSLPQKFCQAAARAPHSTAVICGTTRLSWSELSNASHRLALRLMDEGIKRDQHLPLITQRSPAHIIGILGTVLAGAGFVPLEANLPEMRVRAICQELGAPFILTEKALAESLPSAIPKLLIDPSLPETSQPDKVQKLPEILPSQLAYAIYTSGSTGKPKAVTISHGALATYLSSIQKTLQLEQCQSFTMVSTLAADLGYTSLFPALALGATLHLIQQEVFFDPNQFAEYMTHHQIDTLKVVPSYLEVLLQSRDPQKVLPKKCLILGGEKASESLLNQLRELKPTCKIYNHYGPTETTIGVLTYGPFADATTLPLGRPLPHVKIHILSPKMLHQPRGQSGRLFIGGPQLARGYLNRPAATAAAFIPDPFGSCPGARIYNSGDLVLWDLNDQLSFQRRIDSQLKIRGYRVELGEIESQLASYPSVKRATVHAFTPDSQQAHLMGYWMPNRDIKHPEVESEAIRAFLQKLLPEYMIPHEILMMHQFPLSANGKLDRNRLPGPGSTRSKSSEHLQQPRTPEEQTIADVWRTFLPLKTFSIYDNFFDLGGNSYLMFKIQAALHAHLHKKIGIMELFKNPTIASLAEALSNLTDTHSDLSHIDERVQRRLQARNQRARISSRRTS